MSSRRPVVEVPEVAIGVGASDEDEDTRDFYIWDPPPDDDKNTTTPAASESFRAVDFLCTMWANSMSAQAALCRGRPPPKASAMWTDITRSSQDIFGMVRANTIVCTLNKFRHILYRDVKIMESIATDFAAALYTQDSQFLTDQSSLDRLFISATRANKLLLPHLGYKRQHAKPSSSYTRVPKRQCTQKC